MPTLAAAPTNGVMVLTWPVYYPGYVLQVNTNLSTTNWTIYNGAVMTNGNRLNAVMMVSASRPMNMWLLMFGIHFLG